MEEYELKGTLEGLEKILQQDFDMPQKEARFFIYILINQDKTLNIDKKELDEWYFNQRDKYTGRIFYTHYSINFTNIKKEICHNAYIFILGFFFSRGFDLFQIGLELLYVICEAVRHVSDIDYCVFARIIELNIGNKGTLFGVDEIKTANKEGKCDYQDENWKCPYLRENDDCINTNEKIKLSLENLERKDIVKKVGSFWVLQ
ncbi:MAG: hypothetical protein NC416_06180 [Eubacterium sp.]|nr:hypothetical protein [Eubacterium sp.]